MHLAPVVGDKGVGGEDLAPPFYRKFINFLLKHCEIWNQGQFKY